VEEKKTRGAFLKSRPPGPPEKLLLALRAITAPMHALLINKSFWESKTLFSKRVLAAGGIITLLILTGCGSNEKPAAYPGDESSARQNTVVLEFSMNVDRQIYKYSDFGEPPQLAVWLEQPVTGKIRTVWVARRSGRRLWKGKVECPTALPFWESRHKKEKSEFQHRGLLERLVDAISGATPKGGVFKVNVTVPRGGKWDYYIEMNVSGDYNVHFPSRLENGTPDPEGNGQPSLVYKGQIEARPNASDSPVLTGRTNQWVAVDTVIPDLTGITSAKKVLSNIKVFVL
jgi:hypothetical protein